MNPKMKSAIEKITLNDATFSNEVIEPTYVNFFYGKNGAGKSTIARTFKANDERLQSSDNGRIIEIPYLYRLDRKEIGTEIIAKINREGYLQ